MKNDGHYWLLLPQHAVERLQKEFSNLHIMAADKKEPLSLGKFTHITIRRSEL